MHRTKDNMMAAVDADEVKLCEVSKHSFGIVSVYAQVSIGIIVAIGLVYFLLPALMENTDDAIFLANVFAAFGVLLAFFIITVSTFVYRQNRLIVTDRNITQVLQVSLFSRKTSQLNLYNVEDVTASENGFLSTILGFGELVIETAGEQANFRYNYCPRPGYYAKIILDAREKLLGQMKKQSVNEKKRSVKSIGKEILDHTSLGDDVESMVKIR
jgi:uncharacterized membrane protein YdbT with pleckstrin-like domain